ncbi:MAG: hypothetical protein E7813_16545 [Bradyrhizobium sp.]|nr:MAG: hypothetical protein E7813_16545 [Bradyrhizobium sp.]
MAMKHFRRFFQTAFTQFWQRIVKAPRLAGRYRPELHYMRGPGPKSLGQKRLEIANSDKR